MLYFLILLLLTILIFNYDLRFGRKIKFKLDEMMYNFVLIIFVLVAALRWEVGGDSIVYRHYYESDLPTLLNLNIQTFLYSYYEPLFIIFMSLCKTIINDFCFFQLVHALFVNIIIFNFIKKYTHYKFAGVFIYGFVYYLYFNMEIIRQAISICIFLLSYPYYKENKWLKYTFLILLAAQFHTSAYILTVIPFFKGLSTKKKSLAKILLISCITITCTIFFLSDFISKISDVDLQERTKYYADAKYNLNGMITTFLSLIIIPYVIFQITKKKKEIMEFENLLYPYIFIASICVLVPGFERMLTYFSIPLILYYTNIIFDIPKNRQLKKLKYPIIITMILIPCILRLPFYMRSTNHLVSGTTLFNCWYPYSSVFDKKRYDKREVLYQEIMKEASER